VLSAIYFRNTITNTPNRLQEQHARSTVRR
jgi:hypothetical protein